MPESVPSGVVTITGQTIVAEGSVITEVEKVPAGVVQPTTTNILVEGNPVRE